MGHLVLETGILLLGAFLLGCLAGAVAKYLLHRLTREKAQVVQSARTGRPPVPNPVHGLSLDDRPDGLSGPRRGGADDLKRINGIGPRIECLLNDLGIYHFDQIAEWSETNVQWIDENLRFHGRVEREVWVQQAADLATAARYKVNTDNVAD